MEPKIKPLVAFAAVTGWGGCPIDARQDGRGQPEGPWSGKHGLDRIPTTHVPARGMGVRGKSRVEDHSRPH